MGAQAGFRIDAFSSRSIPMAGPGMVRLVKGFGFSQSYPTAVFNEGLMGRSVWQQQSLRGIVPRGR